MTSSPFIVAVAIPSPIPDPEQQPKEQSDVQNEATPHEESEQVQQQEPQESEEVQQELQESQEVHETQDVQGSLLGDQQEMVVSEPVVSPLVYQVMWMESSDSRVVGSGAVKSFEIVPTQNN